jgi:hypothetical protein
VDVSDDDRKHGRGGLVRPSTVYSDAIGDLLIRNSRLRQYEAKVRAQHRERIEAARELQLAEELAEIEEMERRARDSARAGMERS